MRCRVSEKKASSCSSLINLKSHFKLREIENINNVVYTKMPNPNDATLLNLVKATVVIGPCVQQNFKFYLYGKRELRKGISKRLCPRN